MEEPGEELLGSLIEDLGWAPGISEMSVAKFGLTRFEDLPTSFSTSNNYLTFSSSIINIK